MTNRMHFILFVCCCCCLSTLLLSKEENDVLINQAIHSYNFGRKLQYTDYCLVNGIASYNCIQQSIDAYTTSKHILEELSYTNEIFDYFGMLNDIGVQYIDIGEYENANAVFIEILKFQPTHINALSNLGMTEQVLRRYDQAIDIYSRLINIDPNNSYHYYNLGCLYYKMNSDPMYKYDNCKQNSQRLWLQSIEKNNNLYQAYINLASLECKNYEIVSNYYSLAVAASIKLNNSFAWGILFQYIGSKYPVVYSYLHNNIDDIRLDIIQNLLSFKLINFSNYNAYDLVGCASLGYYGIYQGYEDMFIRSLFAYTFWKLSYKSLTYVAPFLHESNKQSSQTKFKIGFLSSYFYRHSVGLLLQGVIKNIDRNVFDVYILHIANKDSVYHVDHITNALQSSDSIYMFLNNSLETTQREVGSLHLDILVFGEIGMDSTTYFLAFSRLAKKSLSFWGHATSSGINSNIFHGISKSILSLDELDLVTQSVIDNFGEDKTSAINNVNNTFAVDYFVSSTLFEPFPSEAQLEYSERLILLDSLTTYFYWPTIPLSALELNLSPNHKYLCIANIRMKQLGLLELTLLDKQQVNYHNNCDTSHEYTLMLTSMQSWLLSFNITLQLDSIDNLHFYAIPQVLYKLHPDFDEIVYEILHQDPSAILCFLDASRESYKSILMERLINKYPLIELNLHRVVFLPTLSEREYLTFCTISDVVLDPFPVGGGRSSLEIFSTGTPIVFYPNRTSILQLTWGMYKVMEISPYEEYLLARNISHFAYLAIQVAKNQTINSYLRDLILQNNFKLFENGNVIDEWNRMLVFIATNDRPQSGIFTIQDYKYPINNHLWNRNELNSSIFSFIEPPIVLSKVISSLSEVNNINDQVDMTITSITFEVDQKTISITVHQNEDWKERCYLTLLHYNVTKELHHIFICRILGLEVERHSWESFLNVTVVIPLEEDSDNKQISYNLEIKKGDYLPMILESFRKKHQLSDLQLSKILNSIYPQYISQEDVGSDEWIEIRNKVSFQYTRWFENRPRDVFNKELKALETLWCQHHANGGSNLRSLSIASYSSLAMITIGITSCKRFLYFKATLDALFHGLGPLPNQLIAEIIVIDDSSSISDRMKMLELYPTINFIFKSETDKGHGKSLNSLLRLVKTRYLIYLEDDWVLMDDDAMIYSNKYFELNEELNNFCIDNDVNKLNRIYKVLLMSLSILGYNGQVILPDAKFESNISFNMTSKHSSSKIPHQVLFNEQSNRDCAVGNHKDCRQQDIRDGGWERKVFMNLNNSQFAIDYSLHEFGLTVSYKNQRNHNFNFWPGLSFNPGLWDLDRINRDIWSCLNDHSSSSNDIVSNVDRFDENDLSFEWRFSILAYVNGLHMAYLPLLLWKHIGDISAYAISGSKRPWSITDQLYNNSLDTL